MMLFTSCLLQHGGLLTITIGEDVNLFLDISIRWIKT